MSNGYWVSKCGLRVPKADNPLRKQWDAAYLARVSDYFGDKDRDLVPAHIPVSKLIGGHGASADNSRGQFYVRLLKLGERIPPIVVSEMGDGNYHVLDGNHRVAAAQVSGTSHLHALVIKDKKGAKPRSTSPHVFTGTKVKKLGAKPMKKSEGADILDLSKHEREVPPELPQRIIHALWAIRQPGVLTDELRQPQYRSNPDPFAGHCFVATNALYHLIDGPKTGWSMKCIHKEHMEGLADDSHWFLQHKKTGHIIDPTADQFDSVPPYEKAVSKGTSQTGEDVGKPTQRAEKVIKRARAVMAGEPLTKGEEEMEKAESSPEFESWFSGSKAVDHEGKPLKFFHGTSKDRDFHTFKTGQRGAWFTDDPEEASLYADQNDSRGAKLDRYTMQYKEHNTAGRVIPVHLSIKNPYTPSFEEFKEMKHAQNYAWAQRKLFEKAKLAGHDGANMGAGIWVAFNPNQIKSVFNTKPTQHLAIHKAELAKAIAPGTQTGSFNKDVAQEWDYSHLLPQHARDEGYRIRLIAHKYKGGAGNSGHVQVLARQTVDGRTRHVGATTGHFDGGTVLVRDALVEEKDRGASRRKAGKKPLGVGTALYEALYAHARAQLGCTAAEGDIHSTSAHNVHRKLSRKHGLTYEGKPNIRRTGGLGYRDMDEWRETPASDHDGKYEEYGYRLPDVLEPKQTNSFAEHKLPGSLHAEGYRLNISHSPDTTIGTIHRHGEVLGHIELTPKGHAFEEWTGENNRTGLSDAVLSVLRGHMGGEAGHDEWNNASKPEQMMKAEQVDLTDLLKAIRPTKQVKFDKLPEPPTGRRPDSTRPPLPGYKAQPYGSDKNNTFDYSHLLPKEFQGKYRIYVHTTDYTGEKGHERQSTVTVHRAPQPGPTPVDMAAREPILTAYGNHIKVPTNNIRTEGLYRQAIQPHIMPLTDRRAAGITPYAMMALLAHARNNHGIKMLDIPEHTPAASNMIRRYLGLIGAKYEGQQVPNPQHGDAQYDPFVRDPEHMFTGQRVMLKAEDIGPADGSHITAPHQSYVHGAAAKPFGTEYEGGKNVWGRNHPGKSNKGRTLMVQFSSDLLQGGRKKDEADQYYDKLYSKREGYHRGQDFWEVPQWQAHMAHSMPNADHYTVRDPEEAIKFMGAAGYDHVAFSALDVNKDFVRRLAEGAPDQHVVVGGYTDMAHFGDLKNVSVHPSIKSFVESEGHTYQPGYDYRHFTGMKTIPRLTLSDGCRHQCTFCCVPKQVNEKTREEILQQADSFATHLPSDLIYLNDKTFGQAKNHAMLPEIYQRIKAKNPGFKGFIIQTTAAQMKRFTPEYMKQAGIKHVELGVESVNDPILKAHKKPATEAIIEDAANKVRAAGASLIPNIMVGLPGEDRTTYARTLGWLQKHRDIISHVNAYNLALYDDSELGKKLQVINAADRDENVQQKSWHTDPQAHADFAKALFGFANGQLDQPIGHTQLVKFEDLVLLDLKKNQPLPGHEQVGEQLGSNPGGVYQHKKTGKQYYVKFAPTNDHAHNEHLAFHLYQAAGVPTPNVSLVEHQKGKLATTSEMLPAVDLETNADYHNAAQHFGAHAWLANWDALVSGNTVNVEGVPHTIDAGGALQYRAMGGPKGNLFGTQVGEFSTMRDLKMNGAARAFQRLSPDEVAASVARVGNVSDQTIDELVRAYGPVEKEKAEWLASTLKARKQHLLAQAHAETGIKPLGKAEGPHPYFAAADEAPTNEGIEAAEQAYHGGVANLGDPDAAHHIQGMGGYFDYRSHLENAAHQHLGAEFPVWRNMSVEQYRGWRNGENVGPVSVTLNPDVARNWSKLAAVKGERSVVQLKATPASILMRGRPEEHELVIDGDQVELPMAKAQAFMKSPAFRHIASGKVVATPVFHDTAHLGRVAKLKFDKENDEYPEAYTHWEAGFLDHAGNFFNREDALRAVSTSKTPSSTISAAMQADGGLESTQYAAGQSKGIFKAEVDRHDPVSCVVMVQDALGRTLWGKRKDGKYTMPAGHANQNELPPDCAKRELMEEAGLKAEALWLIGSANGNEGPVHVYHAVSHGKACTDLDPDREMASWEWVDCLRGPPPHITANLAHNPNAVYALMGWEQPLAKGAMQRVAPMKHPPNKNPSYPDPRMLHNWQEGAEDVPSDGRNSIKPMAGPVLARGLHRLHGHTQVRRSAETGEREFLLHRGVGALEYSLGDRGPGSFAPNELSSWTPHRDVAERFSRNVVTAWIPEGHIHALGSMNPWSNDSDLKRESEVIVRPGQFERHQPAMAKSEDDEQEAPPRPPPDRSYERRFPLPEYSHFGPKNIHKQWKNTQYLDEPSRENPGERKSIWDLDQRDIDPIREMDFKRNAPHLSTISKAVHKMVGGTKAYSSDRIHDFIVDSDLPSQSEHPDFPGTFTSQAFHSDTGNHIAKEDAKRLAYLFGDDEAVSHKDSVPSFKMALHEMMHGASGQYKYDTHDRRFIEEATTEVLAQHYMPQVLKHSHDIDLSYYGGGHENPLVRIDSKTGETYLDRPVSYHGWVDKFAKVVAHIEGLDEPAKLDETGHYSGDEHDEKERKLSHMVAWYALKMKQMGHHESSRSTWLQQMWIHRKLGVSPPAVAVSHPYYGIRNRLHDLAFDPIGKHYVFNAETNKHEEVDPPRGIFHHSREVTRDTLKAITEELAKTHRLSYVRVSDPGYEAANPEKDPYAP